jgi:acyl-CoA reductase-like NAD-dependent aldehyde dehydrogenase
MDRERVEVRKTYKLFIGGQFPRSESGRSYRPAGGAHNVARASRKDLRDAVVAARAAFGGWRGRDAYNRGQILYRCAEMLETRKGSLADEIRACSGASAAAARREVEKCVDLATWFAGLPDKLQSLLGSQNAVSGPFFNFSTVEPTGVIGVVAPEQPSLLGLLALLLPVLAGGNVAVALVSEQAPLPGLALGELLAVSDLPGGVVNLLAGERNELLAQFAAHRDLDGLLLAGKPDRALGAVAADSVKRVRWADLTPAQWAKPASAQSLLWIEPFVEVKTLWHPVAQ